MGALAIGKAKEGSFIWLIYEENFALFLRSSSKYHFYMSNNIRKRGGWDGVKG